MLGVTAAARAATAAPSSAPAAGASASIEEEAPPAPSATAPAASASPTDVFAAKIALLDKIDDAVMSGKPDALATLVVPEAALEGCSQGARDRGRASFDVKDCGVISASRPTRAAINVGSRSELVDEACALADLEKSELFYRSGGHSLKITVHSVAIGKDAHLKRIHCHRSERPTKETSVANCTGKWPFVTQTREFTTCPWSKP
jgi:hypothetical protein